MLTSNVTRPEKLLLVLNYMKLFCWCCKIYVKCSLFHNDWWEYHSFFLLSYRKIQKQACFLICGHKTRKQNIVLEAKFSYVFNFPNKSFSCKYKLLRLQDNFTSDFIQYCFKIGNVTRPEILVLWLSSNWNYERLYWPEQFVLVIMKSLEDFCSK